MARPMVPPSNIDSSLLKRSIEQWEVLLTCHQCHRIVESIATLWEGENQQSLCSQCCPKLARSIFTCINKPTMDIDNPNASDPGRVVQLLKWLLAAYQRQELKQQTLTNPTSSFAMHDQQTSSGHVHSTMYQTTNIRKNLTKTCHQEDGHSLSESADDIRAEHDKKLGETTLQTCTHTPSSCQEQSEQQNSTIPCSSPCRDSSTLIFESQHVGMSQSNSASTATFQSTQQHSQQDLLLSLPETADFERIFPGPILTTQTSHQSQPESHQPIDSGSELLSSVEEFSGSKSPQLVPNEPSTHATELVEYQLSCSSRLPETADFDNILCPPNQGPTDDNNHTSTSNESPFEESELPCTEDFDRIYPMKRQEDHVNTNTEVTSTNHDPTVISVPCPAVVSPVDGATATKLRERREDAVQSKKKDSASCPIITPRARNKRCHDGHTNIGTKTPKNRKIGASSDDPTSYSTLDAVHNTRRAFPCQVRQHPFRNAQSNLGTINICARSFQYLHALANGWNIEGEHGETIWGDAQVYAQTISQLSAPTRDGNSWIRQAPWWGTTRQSPCPRLSLTRERFGATIQTKLLDGYRILLISNRDLYDEDSVPFFDYSVLHDWQENQDTCNISFQEFKSLTFDEMTSLCQAAGVEILESISAVHKPANVTEKLLIVVAEEIDDEIFTERLFPRLVERGVLPTQCKVHIPPSFSETKVLPLDDAMIPILYFSWLVESIAAGIAAPTLPYSLGILHL